MSTIRILVWKKGTNRATSEADYMIEIEAGVLVSLVVALERIASELEEKEEK